MDVMHCVMTVSLFFVGFQKPIVRKFVISKKDSQPSPIKNYIFFQSRTFWCYLILSFQDLFSVGKYVFSFFRTFFFYKLNPNQDFSESTYFCIVVVGLGFLWVFINILDQEDENKLQGHLLTADINICFTSFLIVK